MRKPARNLRIYTKGQLENALEVQNSKHGWNFFHEREFVENLFTQRFNFLLVVYAIFVAASLSISNPQIAAVVFVTGAVLVLIIWALVHRAFIKFDTALRICYRIENSAVRMVDAEARKRPDRLRRVNPLMANGVPLFCFVTLFAGALLAWFQVFPFNA